MYTQARWLIVLGSVALIAVACTTLSAGPTASPTKPASAPTAPPEASPTPELTIEPSLSERIPTIRGEFDGVTLLLAPKIGECFTMADVDFVYPSTRGADAAIDELDADHGWVEWAEGNDDHRLFYGDVESAAIELGGVKLALGSDGAWILMPDGTADELREISTPRGRSLWLRANHVQRGDCPKG